MYVEEPLYLRPCTNDDLTILISSNPKELNEIIGEIFVLRSELLPQVRNILGFHGDKLGKH